MPSLTTTILTSAVTLTSFVTMTTAQLAPPSIFEEVEKLGQCSQTVIFECLSVSTCNPTDFPCICTELSRLGIESKVTAACPKEKDAYLKFAADVCAQPKPASSSAIVYPTYPVVYPSSTTPDVYSASTPDVYSASTPVVYPSYPIYTPSGKNNVTSSMPTPGPKPTPTPEPSPPPPGPYPSSEPAKSGSEPAPGPGPAPSPGPGPAPSPGPGPAPSPGPGPAPSPGPGPAPSGDSTTTVKLTTVVTQIVTTGAGGQPTTITSEIVTPVPSTTEPATPEFTGAAAALNIKNTAVAGVVGLMGYVFAAL